MAEGFLEAFRATVARAGTRTAVVSPAATIDYRGLDEWTDVVAEEIVRRVGSGPEPVAILAGNDEWCVAAFVASAKAGRPSVVLDPTAPGERIATICESAGPVAILIDPALNPSTADLDPAWPLIEIPGPGRTGEGDAEPARMRETVDGEVLTLLFTSGSTGRPKGVIVGSTAVVGAMPWDSLGGDGDIIGCPIPLGFAFGLFTAIHTLITGSALHLIDTRKSGVAQVPGWLDDNAISGLAITPYLVRAVAAELGDAVHRFASLRHVTIGGEPVLASDVLALRRLVSDDCIIHNMLGSSETWAMATLAVTADYPLDPAGGVPVGFPGPGREIWLLDDAGDRIHEPDRLGVINFVATHLSGGYWRDPAATAERFARLPDGRTRYDTRDLGRFNTRGELQHVGRADDLLKIRGYLVEPAEVEKHLRAGGEVRECVVLGLPSSLRPGTTRLVAYVEPEPAQWLSSSAIRRRLVGELPSYMVPVEFIELGALPRNPNGKIDRAALPVPVEQVGAEGEELWGYALVVAGICAAALGLETIGEDDDIFALGADSLAVEEIAAALEGQFGIEVSSFSVMENPTVAELAKLPGRSAGTAPRGEMTVLANGIGAGAVFGIAGGGGLALELRDLAKEIALDGRTFYGLQSHGLERAGQPDMTIRAMAARYERSIRAVQPTGPYHLIGYSLGAVVALELANRLRRSGEDVAYLGLLDPPNPSDDGVAAPLRNFKPDDDRVRPAPSRTAARGIRSLSDLRYWVYVNHPRWTRSFWREVRKGGRYRLWFEIGSEAVRRYRPRKPLAGVTATIYFVAGRTESIPEGWFEEPPHVVVVGGDHLTMLRRPYVEGLSRLVREHLGLASPVDRAAR